MISRNCLVCGAPFFTHKAWVRRGYGTYCGRACSDKGRTKPKITMFPYACLECGVIFYRQLGKGKNPTFCSMQCLGNFNGRRIEGSKHPKWRGGISERPYEVTRVIRRRVAEVGKCEECGSTNNLQGHHVRTYSECPDLRCSSSNIMVLCVICHAQKHPEYSNLMLSKVVKEKGVVIQ
jgi:hypothetical protein